MSLLIRQALLSILTDMRWTYLFHLSYNNYFEQTVKTGRDGVYNTAAVGRNGEGMHVE